MKPNYITPKSRITADNIMLKRVFVWSFGKKIRLDRY